MVKILFILTTAALLVTSALGAPLTPVAQSIVTDSNIVLQGRSTNVFASNQVQLIRSISNYVASVVAGGVPGAYDYTALSNNIKSDIASSNFVNQIRLDQTNLLILSRLTNYVNVISNTVALTNGILATNYTLTIGQNNTNYSLIIGSDNTNLSMAIGLNGTNYANTAAGNASNSAIAKATADLGLTNGLLQTRLSNYVNTVSNLIALTNGILATNYTLAVAQNNTNLSMAIGLNATNYANTVAGNASNSAVNRIISSNYVTQTTLDATNTLLLTAVTNATNGFTGGHNFDPNFITNGLNKIALSGDLTLTNVSITGTLDVNEISASSLSLTNPIGVGPGGTGLTNLYSGLMMGNGTNPVRFATPIYSIYFTNVTNISFVGDAAAPGNSKYYGTDISGNKGFFTLPAGGGSGGTPLYTNSVLVIASNLNFIGFPMTNDGQYLHVGVPALTYDYTGLSNNIKSDIAASNFVNQTKLDQTNIVLLTRMTNYVNGISNTVVLTNGILATNYANTVAGNASNSVVGALVSNAVPFFNNLGYLTNSILVQKFGSIGVGINPSDATYKLIVDGQLKVATGIDITGSASAGGGVASPDGFSPGLSTNNAKITAAGSAGSDLSSIRIQSYQRRGGIPTPTNNLYVSGSINSGVTNSTSGVVFSGITNILGGTTFLNGTDTTNQAVASWWLSSTNGLIQTQLTNYVNTISNLISLTNGILATNYTLTIAGYNTNYANAMAGSASNSAMANIQSSNYVTQTKLDQTNLLILGAITNATNGFSSGNNYDTDYFYTNGSSKVSLLTNLYLPFATIGTATISNSIFLDPVFTNLSVYGPITSTNLDARLAEASNSAIANIQSSNYVTAFSLALLSTNTYTTNLYVSNLVASVASIMTLNIDAATITNFNAISATFSNITVTNFNVVTQTVDVLVVSNLQALSVGITNSAGTNYLGTTVMSDLTLTNLSLIGNATGLVNVASNSVPVASSPTNITFNFVPSGVGSFVTSTDLQNGTNAANSTLTNRTVNMLTNVVAGPGISLGIVNNTVTITNTGSSGGGATPYIINTATGAVWYALSGTAQVILYKTNSTYDLTLTNATTTQVISGDGVWVDIVPVGSSYILRW